MSARPVLAMLGVVGVEDVVDDVVVVEVFVVDGDGEEGVNLGGAVEVGVEGEGREGGLFAVVEVEEVD